MLNHLLSSPRMYRLLWHQKILMLQLDPLNWNCLSIIGPGIGPCIWVRDDVNPMRLQRPYYERLEL